MLSRLFPILRPILFRLSPERAHRLTIALLERLPAGNAIFDPVLGQSVAGLHFAGPLGLAAGFDKDARIYNQIGSFGFAFAEAGTLTPRPQDGNPLPRLFRLVEDRAVINRMGFNNAGLEAACRRIEAGGRRNGLLGINIGANKDSPDRIADYAIGMARAAPIADYVTVNISSPNTPGLRALQDRGALDDLLAAVMAARGGRPVPVWLKVAPDLLDDDITDIAAIAMTHRVDALVVGNTTLARPATLQSRHAGESGGLSGAPLCMPALDRLRQFRRATGGQIPLVGVGGIASADHAYDRIRAGASLLQLYSAMVFEGPWIARSIHDGLAMRLRRDGFASIAEAVGIDCPL